MGRGHHRSPRSRRRTTSLRALPELAGAADERQGPRHRSSATSPRSSPSGPSAGRSPTDERQLFIDRQFESTAGPRPRGEARRSARAQVAALPLSRRRERLRSSTRSRRASRSSSGIPRPTARSSTPRPRASSARARRSPQQAERMLADPRAKAKVREFLLAWLKIDRPKDLAKDAKRFPGFDARAGRRPPHVAGTLPRRRGLERALRLPATPPRRTRSTSTAGSRGSTARPTDGG